jgi:hypothetical protein
MEIFKDLSERSRYLFSLIFFSAIAFSLASCSTITDTLYVQEINVKGPVNQPPVKVTSKDTALFTISPRFFFNTKKNYSGLIEGHTKVNSEGFFQIDTLRNGNELSYRETPGANTNEFYGENLYWSLPDYYVGFDIDIPLSKKIVLSGGFNLSSKEKTNLYGYRIGFGFLSLKDNLGIRFDGGIIWQKYSFEAASVVVRNNSDLSESEVFFFRDKESSVNINHYFSLTFNTAYENFPFNFLINLGYSGQTLVDYEPRDVDYSFYLFDPNYRLKDARGEAYAAFVNASPGIYADINEWSRIIFAVRFFYELDIKDSHNSQFIIPMVQLDMSF